MGILDDFFGSRQTGAQTTTSTAAPWAPAQPYMQQQLGEAGRAYQMGGPQTFPYSRVAPMTAAQNQFLQSGMGMAGAPQDLIGTGQEALRATAAGEMIGQNPYLDEAFQRGAGEISRGIESQFNVGGRYQPGGAMTDVTGDILGDFGAKLYGGAYGTERAQQLQAAGMMPGMAEAGYQGVERGLRYADPYQQLGQRQLTDVAGRFGEEQRRPYENIDWYGGQLGAYSPYGARTTEQPLYGSTAGGMMQGATTGMNLARAAQDLGIMDPGSAWSTAMPWLGAAGGMFV